MFPSRTGWTTDSDSEQSSQTLRFKLDPRRLSPSFALTFRLRLLCLCSPDCAFDTERSQFSGMATVGREPLLHPDAFGAGYTGLLPTTPMPTCHVVAAGVDHTFEEAHLCTSSCLPLGWRNLLVELDWWLAEEMLDLRWSSNGWNLDTGIFCLDSKEKSNLSPASIANKHFGLHLQTAVVFASQANV